MSLLATKPAPTTAADIRAAIQRHFGTGGEKYAVLFEVRNGTAWRADRSVDAVVMSLWPSLGMELWGMEIKVSRHDWRRELKQPSKASAVFDYFDRWFLVAPENVVATGEIPEPWGWFVPTADGLHGARDAAKNSNVKPVDRHFLAALLRRVAKTDDDFIHASVATALDAQRRTHEAEVERRALERAGDLRKDAEAWIKLRDLLKTKPDDYVFAGDVVEALRVLIKCGVVKSYGGLRSLIETVNASKEQLDKIAEDLKIPKRVAR
jgi:hypothetical protein